MIVLAGCHSAMDPGVSADRDAAPLDTAASRDAVADAEGLDGPFSSTELGFAEITLSNATDVDQLTIEAVVGLGAQPVSACAAAPIHGCCVVSTTGQAFVSTTIGPIEIDDQVPIATLVPVGSPVVYPTYTSTSGPHWRARDSLRVSAPGGVLSSFVDNALVAPGPVTGLVPAIPAGAPTTNQSVTQDLAITWTPDTASTDFTIVLSSGLGDNDIQCLEPQAQGSLVVDHSLFSQVGLLANRTGSITAINSTTLASAAGSQSGTQITISVRSQIGGTATLDFVP
jgi:hypothetical protein